MGSLSHPPTLCLAAATLEEDLLDIPAFIEVCGESAERPRDALCWRRERNPLPPRRPLPDEGLPKPQYCRAVLSEGRSGSFAPARGTPIPLPPVFGACRAFRRAPRPSPRLHSFS